MEPSPWVTTHRLQTHCSDQYERGPGIQTVSLRDIVPPEVLEQTQETVYLLKHQCQRASVDEPVFESIHTNPPPSFR